MSQEAVEAALAGLRAEDARLAGWAEAAAEWLGAGEGLDGLSQHRLQRFLWWELPLKWFGSPGEEASLQADVREALARLLARLGLERYAFVCRSAITERVHAAYLRSDEDGVRAFNEAVLGSGLAPPDLDDFTWGGLMGFEEAVAFEVVAIALEEAIVGGELVVGRRGWKPLQRRLAAAALDAGHPGHPGQSRRQVIMGERIANWRGAARGPALAVLRERAAPPLRDPVAAPDGLHAAFEPLHWFLEVIEGGVRLTEKGNLARAFVEQAAQARAWWPLPGALRGEDDVIELTELHATARALRLVRRRGRTLHPTETGRELVADGARLWERFVSMLANRSGFGGVCLEMSALLLLEDASGVSYLRLLEEVAALAGAEGYRSMSPGNPTGEPPRSFDVAWEVAGPLRLLDLFGMLSTRDDGGDRQWAVTPVGDATLRALLRARATAPRERGRA